MALDQNKLKDNLFAWLQNVNVANIADSAEDFADAYEDYAFDAQDPSGDSPSILNRAGLVSAIAGLPAIGTAINAAQIFATGIVAYWTGGIFEITPPELASVVITPPVPALISVPLTTVFLDNSVDDPEDPDVTYDRKADEIATLLHAATITTIVSIALPAPSSPIVGPIS